MEILHELFLSSGFTRLAWQNITMFLVGGVLITLAVKKNFEPLLLIPIGFGAILANIPGAEMVANDKGLIPDPSDSNDKWPLFAFIYNYAVSKAELLPPIIFMGVGALTDFRPLLGRPITFLLGAAAQLGFSSQHSAHFTYSNSIFPRQPPSALLAVRTDQPPFF